MRDMLADMRGGSVGGSWNILGERPDMRDIVADMKDMLGYMRDMVDDMRDMVDNMKGT